MDINISWLDTIKLGVKFVQYKVLQQSLSTKDVFNVTTSYGPIRGLKRKNVYPEAGTYVAFEGIPYAKPPLGQLRFRSPQKLDTWSDVLDCTSTRAKPMQYQMLLGYHEGSEDCLHLNIYTPRLESPSPLPVMVWIYGGAFTVGEASRDVYAPDYFMTKDVVLVTLNYRVGPLGFLSFKDPDLNIPGNAGLKDQVMALRWIQENIQFFNGDTNNVTLFGESAGAASIHLLMLAERARGLFHKAVLQSGTALCPWVNSYLTDGNYRLAKYLGYKGENTDRNIYEYFMQLKAKAFAVQPTKLFGRQERLEQCVVGFGVVIEPYDTHDSLIRKPIKELLSTAWGNSIPVLIGGTSFEGLLYHTSTIIASHILKELPDNHFVESLMPDIRNSHTQSELIEMGDRLKIHYFGNEEHPNIDGTNKETLLQYLDLMSYSGFWHGIHRTILARCKYAANSKTFCYRFDMDSTFFNHYRILKCGNSVRGVSHADDISYLFYNVLAQKLPPESDEYKTIKDMINIWHNFALYSNPSPHHIEGIKWDSIQNANVPYKCMNIKNDLTYMVLPEYEKLKLWDSFYNESDLI